MERDLESRFERPLERSFERPLGICFGEPTIDELLDDSLTQGLMEADGVDVTALRSMLYGLASTIESRPAIQRDRTSANRGVVAWTDQAALQLASPKMASLPATAARRSNPCLAC
jgi:hypothetical protein